MKEEFTQADLEEMARKAALSVIKYKKRYVLHPMPAEDRKMIHNKVKEFNGVFSFSQGYEGRRSVVVDLISNKSQYEDGSEKQKNEFKDK